MIGIVGLGLMGGSFAKALKARTEEKVYATDLREEVLDQALEEGVLDGILTEETLPQMDAVVLAVRPGAAMQWTREHAPLLAGCLLMDFCGVKKGLFETLEELSEAYDFEYLGTHPMAGREVGGYENALESLFEGASMIWMRSKTTSDVSLKKALDLFLSLGFTKLQESDPKTHDQRIAYTSQLAHVASNAFVKSPQSVLHKGYSADSLRDLTRVARLDADMWTELFLANKENLEEELTGYIAHLEEYLKAIREGDAKGLKCLLQAGDAKKKEMYPKGRS